MGSSASTGRLRIRQARRSCICGATLLCHSANAKPALVREDHGFLVPAKGSALRDRIVLCGRLAVAGRDCDMPFRTYLSKFVDIKVDVENELE
jgi:hypothetical protein